MSRHFMREANPLKAPLKPGAPGYLIQTRQEIGEMTVVKECCYAFFEFGGTGET